MENNEVPLAKLIHDLNGQLFVVRGNAELIEMTSQDASVREKSMKLIRACDKLADITQEIHRRVRGEQDPEAERKHG